MLNHKKRLQTSSDSKRKCKYILPLSKPKLLLDSTSFKNNSSDIGFTFTQVIGKNNFSLKNLKTQRLHDKNYQKMRSDQNRMVNTLLRVNNYRAKISKFDIILCTKDKQMEISVNGNTVQELTRQVKKHLRLNKMSSNFKTVQSVQDSLAFNYLLSVPEKQLQGLLYKKIKITPYYGSQQGQVNLQNFQIVRAIGSGGFSTVYLTRFKGDGRFYAMKVISKSFISKNRKQKLVINQKYVMTTTNHPYLAKLQWSFQSKNYLIFVMDYYPGGELFGLLKKYKRMSESMARFYITEILLGLEQLHNLGVAYRDLKPENILLDKDGHACISDFGLVKLGLHSPNSRTYSFCGSPEYMSPQVIARTGHSLNSDFYSLGALLFQLLTGLPPFYNREAEQIYKGTLSGSLSIPSFLSENVKDLLLRLLCKAEGHRIGAKDGVQEVLSHPWFEKMDKQSFIKKMVIPPMSFADIGNLSFNEKQMKQSNDEYVKEMLKQQLNTDYFAYMLPDFRFSRDERDTDTKENIRINANYSHNKSRVFTKKRSTIVASSERLKRFDNFL